MGIDAERAEHQQQRGEAIKGRYEKSRNEKQDSNHLYVFHLHNVLLFSLPNSSSDSKICQMIKRKQHAVRRVRGRLD